MKQYIPKSALVAEIERIEKSIGSDRFLSEFEKGCNHGKEDVCDDLRAFLDSLEVKEVDFGKEIDLAENKYHGFESLSRADVIEIIKYFFGLGLAQKGE